MRGALYVAYGYGWTERAIISARSLRRITTDIRLGIRTDRPDLAQASGAFDDIWTCAFRRHGFWDKIDAIAELPYEQTLYIDSDTYVAEPIDDIFASLERFDLAAAHAPLRSTTPSVCAPASFPELNAGVICLRRSSHIAAFIEDWRGRYAAYLARGVWHDSDQPAFRDAIYESTLRLCVLPPEFNYRCNGPAYAEGLVRVLHGDFDDPSALAARLNADLRQRTSRWRNRKFIVEPTHRPAPDFRE